MRIAIPGYTIVRTLGRGGMATVYLAIQESFEREVALKIMSSSLTADPTFGERFLREARIVSRLVHPNIVTVYDVGVHEGLHFLSMEYVPGQDLKQKRSQLAREDVLRVIKEVARALDFAGRKGYVHRDVKPENIMLHEEDGRAVLMDFGIARPADDTKSGMTQTGTAIGTPHYMSPEQAKGQQVDSRSDIYSLGVVLYLMLVGHVPFDADSAVAVGIKHVSEPIPRLPPSLARFQSIIDKALAKDPQQRYQNGVELCAALNTITGADLEAIRALEARAERNLPGWEGASDAPTVVSGSRSIPVSAAGSAGADEETVAMQATPVPSSQAITAARAAAPPDQHGHEGTSRGAHSAAPSEVISAAAEDRYEQHRADTEKAALWPWFAGLAIAAGVAGWVYYQQSLSRLDHPGAPAPPVAVERQVSPPPREAVAQEKTAATAASGAPVTVPDEYSGSAPQAAAAAAVVEAESVRPLPAPVGHQGAVAVPAKMAPTPLSAASEAAPTGARRTLPERARGLREQLDNDLSVAPALAQAYRDMLTTDPQHQQARWGLTELREFYVSRIRQYLEEGDLDKVRAHIASARESYPQIEEEDSKYQRLLQRVEQAERLQALLDQGRAYLQRDALASPAGANALENFQAVLAEDKANTAAQQGIADVVARYRDLARERLRQGEPQQALLLAEKGLGIAPGDTQLQQLQGDAEAQSVRQQQLQARLERARQRFADGKLIIPRGNSALDGYEAVLAEDKRNREALEGIREVERALVQSIERRIAALDLETAQQRLREARERFAKSDSLFALQARLDSAFEEKALAERPRIPRVIVSNTRLTAIDGPELSRLRVDRTIHIGFRYENFKQPTSVVQAILYDGARSLQIAQVPVIVTGSEGVTFFRIDRPVEGFADGGYNIDLLLGEERLTSQAFRVENNNL